MLYLPALIVGCLIALYWGRVLRLTWKQKKRSGQAANLFPPEPLGRWLRVIWFPAIGLWIALPLSWGLGLSSRIGLRILQPLIDSLIMEWIGAGGAVAAFNATLICWRKMGKSWRMGIDPADRTQLVVSGAYSYLRHPIYALSSLLMLCTMVVYPAPAMWGAGLIHLILLQWEARREEKYLVGLHGQIYIDYAARTGRFIPKLK